MAEVWDIARYVEDHPDDLPQRWRLAKKLYMAWEYRLALEHLQVLKNEGHNRLNVVRYLAATYYRLGRYDEAVRELDEALEIWPDETGLREQLARVLEIAGKRERAAEAWALIKEKDPQHPIAGSAVRRLSKRADDTPVRDLRIEDSDSGIDLRPGRVCPNCGAQNSEEFDRCWQCHALLSGAARDSGRNAAAPSAPAPFLPEETLLMGLGFLAVLVSGAALFLTLRLLFGAREDGLLIATTWDVYRYQMAGLRAGVGLAAFVAWPIALWAALAAVRPRQLVPPALVNFSAIFLAGLTCCATWLPRDLLFFVPVLPIVISLALVLGAFRIGAGRALGVWALHLGIVLALLYGTAAAVERVRLGAFFNPFREIAAVYAFEQKQAQAAADGAYTFPEGATPYRATARWTSTGSAWLDSAAGEVEFTLYNEDKKPGMKFEIAGSSGTLVYDDVNTDRYVRRYTITVGELYTIYVTGADGTPVRLVAAGLLTPVFTE